MFASIERNTLSILPTFDKNPDEYKTKIYKKLEPLRSTKIILLPFIPFAENYPVDLHKSPFVFTGEIYTHDPEEPVEHLARYSCFIPDKKETLNSLNGMFASVFKDLGLKAQFLPKEREEEALDDSIRIQPAIVDYQYCEEARVSVNYHFTGKRRGTLTEKITTEFRDPAFELKMQKPFHHSLNAQSNFQRFRYGLTLAFYKNNLKFIDHLIDEYSKK